jgi:N-acetylmuramate 1-kinase
MTAAEKDPSERIAELVSRYLHASIADVSIDRLTGDASTRSYFRVSTPQESLIVALYGASFDENEGAVARLAAAEAANPAARLTFANDPCAHIEVTALLLEAGLPVPALLKTLGADSMMFIEDVGDIRLQDWMSERSEADAFEAYRYALELVVRIQEATGRALETDSICSHLAFDDAKLRWELGFFFANYFNKYLRMKLDPSTANALQADFKTLCSELASRPRVLTHRDYHARNLMMHGDRMFIIDYQDARMGPVSYDVASLISDPYTALSPEHVAELTEQFIGMKASSKLPISDVSEFQLELELMTVQRMLKAIGTYASQAASNNPIYVPYIEPAATRALAAMEHLGRFEATYNLLKSSLV